MSARLLHEVWRDIANRIIYPGARTRPYAGRGVPIGEDYAAQILTPVLPANAEEFADGGIVAGMHASIGEEVERNLEVRQMCGVFRSKHPVCGGRHSGTGFGR